jgi:hypothetical protein
MYEVTHGAALPPTPTAQRTVDLFGRATASIREHGATREQAAAMAEISAIFGGSDNPTARAARILARTAAERAAGVTA